MAHLTKPTKYNIKDSNIELLGSDVEKRVREHAGDSESAWDDAGQEPGLQVWRIEQFDVVRRPVKGEFYDGDSYIILHTYKKTPESKSLSYNLHFWLGEDTSQDEAGTAAYKTVELDDYLHGVPVQYREIQGHESSHFLSYFPRFICLHGGVASGFRHVSDPLPLDIHILYKISTTPENNLVVREVPAQASSLLQGDVYVLDKGEKVWQFNTKDSAGKEKFKAAEFVRMLVEERQGRSELTVYDEGGSGAGIFLTEFGPDTNLLPSPPTSTSTLSLFRLSDASGNLTFAQVDSPTFNSLSSDDAFLLDTTSEIYIWLGKKASLAERRLAIQYAQRYLYRKGSSDVAVPIVTMREDDESPEFLKAIQA